MTNQPEDPMPPSYPPRPGDESGRQRAEGATSAPADSEAHPTGSSPAEGAPQDGVVTEKDKAPKKGGLLRETVIVLATALILSVLIKTFLVQAFFIPSSSMEDTLAVGDRIMVNKIAASTDNIQRGDVVVFVDPGGWLPDQGPDTRPAWQRAAGQALTFIGLLPQDAGHHLVKRVIGVGGDEVLCCSADGRIEVNGVAIDEPYIRPGTVPSTTEFHVQVPDGHVWVMGDNRSNSEDARAHMGRPGGGFVPTNNIEGRTFVVLWPVSNIQLLDRPEETFADVPDQP